MESVLSFGFVFLSEGVYRVTQLAVTINYAATSFKARKSLRMESTLTSRRSVCAWSPKKQTLTSIQSARMGVYMQMILMFPQNNPWFFLLGNYEFLILDVEFWTFPRCHTVLQSVPVDERSWESWVDPPFYLLEKAYSSSNDALNIAIFGFRNPKSTWVAFYILGSNAPHEAFSSRLVDVWSTSSPKLQLPQTDAFV